MVGRALERDGGGGVEVPLLTSEAAVIYTISNLRAAIFVTESKIRRLFATAQI